MSLVRFTPSRFTASNTSDYANTRPLGISIRKIKPLIKILAADGASLTELLAGTGLELNDLAMFDMPIHYEQYFRLIENACAIAPDPTFALRLGEQFYINHDGILACRVMSCANAAQAMRLLTDYQSLLTQLFTLSFEVCDSHAIFTVEPNYELGNSLPFFIEYTFASVYSLGKFCTNSSHIEMFYEFTYAATPACKQYAQFFGTHLLFGCPKNRVIIPKSVLAKPFIFENQKTATLHDLKCQDKIRQFSSDNQLIEQVKSLISASNLAEISLAMIADALCMSARTLRRHLKAQNISYKTLLEAERKNVVQKALNQNTPLKIVAEQLGYKDASSFSRAFKQWFGVPPHLFKEK
ncbi:MAG: AraC family transcriptional regulator ligand-binding domain-containing protein [Hahellaceae bacterium]|nr:AraC family transcriptional regulator ligand-binding domain-containing protein [Hahellaceae bacterium]MCP5212339.1 AraC family transcriptional regulator ligand-binding domain-containing protein [Hahellaceae bacterium]